MLDKYHTHDEYEELDYECKDNTNEHTHPIPVRHAHLLLNFCLYTYIINNFILQNINMWV